MIDWKSENIGIRIKITTQKRIKKEPCLNNLNKNKDNKRKSL